MSKLTAKKKLLAAILGGSVLAASLTMETVSLHEGEVLTTYYDPVGVATVCYGDTSPDMAIPGAAYSHEQCLESLLDQLIAHAGPIVETIPTVTESPHMTAAFVSLGYNIGVGAFNKSTVVRRFKAKDYEGACNAIPMWNKAGGKVLKGLVNRREHERQLCLRGVAAMRAYDERQERQEKISSVQSLTRIVNTPSIVNTSKAKNAETGGRG